MLEKTAKKLLWTGTIIQILIAPIFFCLEYLIATHAGRLIALFHPLSVPLSIDLMWSSYFSLKYRKIILYWFLPWITLPLILII